MTPKIKIYGSLKPGSLVYLMDGKKAVTTDKKLAGVGWLDPVGRIIDGPTLKLNASAEKALASLE
ncbi:MAG: hypothetical protein WC822_05785 [Candidatus Paceibacterota bacterium]|jgi:hypothetical protein